MLRNELLIYFPQKEFYSKEEVRGYVELRCPAPMNIYEVNLEIVGVEFVDYQGKKEGNPFLQTDMPLVGTGSKDHGKDLFGYKVKKASLVPPGNHSYQFAFVLPECLPPSFSSPYAKIVYEIRARAVSATKGIQDLQSCAILSVGGSIFDFNFIGNNSLPHTQKESLTYMLTKGSIDIAVNLESKVFLSGDAVRVRIDVSNTTSKTVNQLSARLIQKVEALIGGKEAKTDEFILGMVTLGGVDSKQSKHLQADLPVPTTCPETVINKSVSAKKSIGKNLLISYTVLVYGEVSGLIGSEIKIPIPVYVVRRGRHEQIQQQYQQQPPQSNVVVQPQQIPPQQMPPQQIPPQQMPPQQPFVPPQVVPPQQMAPSQEASFYPSLYPDANSMYPTFAQPPAQVPPQQLPPPPARKPLPVPPVSNVPMQMQAQSNPQSAVYDEFFTE